MSQFRQFWIYEDHNYLLEVCRYKIEKSSEREIHVIEIAALEAAQNEIEQLTAALKVAENAIEREMKWRTVKYCTNDGLDNLGEALNEIQKIKKGLG